MNNFSESFNSFRASFNREEWDNCIPFLDRCFELEPKTSFLKLYTGRYLERMQFLRIIVSSIKIPKSYRISVAMLIHSEDEIESSSLFLSGYSKLQILQGVANVLEKRNAQLKYNQKWNVRYASGNNAYLEAERQALYITTVGIAFQELLKRFYPKASNVDYTKSTVDEDAFDTLLHSLMMYNEVKDALEKHLFFEWSLETASEKSLKSYPPPGQKEGNFKTDLINFQKLKWLSEGIEDVAKDNLFEYYKSPDNNLKKDFKRLEEYISTIGSDDERLWYSQAIALDIKADLDVERELASFERQYFPGIEILKELKMNDGTLIPLRETFRILRFISELSKAHVERIDEGYLTGVNQYSQMNPGSDELKAIEFTAFLFRNDGNTLKETIASNCNDNVLDEQQQIIRNGKSSISDDDCLIKIDFKKIATTIHRLHNYPIGLIESTINLFVYKEGSQSDMTRTPFFIEGNYLCWMPNLVAYVSFSENLIETLLASDKISIHGLQKILFESGLSKLFAKYGYKVIEKEEDKIFKDPSGKDLGDFDLLAYKNRKMIYFELKLTNTRNNYRERRKWKDAKLNEAQRQVKTGLKYIDEHPEHIKKILGLSVDDEIYSIDAFIVSNSFLYDHENIDSFLKVSYLEIMYTLISIEEHFQGQEKSVDAFINCLNDNWLFKKLQDLPFVFEEFVIKIGDYRLIRPGVIQQNQYTSL